MIDGMFTIDSSRNIWIIVESRSASILRRKPKAISSPLDHQTWRRQLPGLSGERNPETFYPNINRGTFDRLMDIAGLQRDSALSKFSKGMRRQAFTALAFAVAPKYLLLDESFDGLDPVARERFKKQVRETAEKGSTIIISSHALSELEGFCDNYLILSEAQLISPEKVADRMRNLYKFQIVFETVPDASLFDILEPQQVHIVARVATVLVSGDKDEIVPKIEKLHPLLYDCLPVEAGEGLLNTVTELAEGGEFA